METEIFGEFRLRLGPEVVISNYCLLKFILSRAMRERESFGDLVKIIVSTFKEDAEKILVHMRDLMQLTKPPFQHTTKGINEARTINANEDEAESTRKAQTPRCVLVLFSLVRFMIMLYLCFISISFFPLNFIGV